MTRPWGLLSKLLPRMQMQPWSFLGCISTEKRSLGAWEVLQKHGGVKTTCMLRIEDPKSRFSSQVEILVKENSRLFTEMTGSLHDIGNHQLLQPYAKTVQEINDFALASSGHIILDISCLPKRFFFPAIRLLLRSHVVETLIVTYTKPESYPAVEMAEDPMNSSHLPLFAGEDPRRAPESLIVALGFQPLGLAETLEGSSETIPTHILFPMSPEPEQLRRNWAFARNVIETVPHVQRPTFVSPVDTAEIFDHLVEMTDGARRYTTLAPYGPKPVSLAMALIANLAEWPVYYTQPRVYHPNYSIGIQRADGIPITYGYCIRLGKQDLYTLPV